MKTLSYIFAMLFSFAVPVFADVAVSSPSNGETVSAPVPFVATGTTSSCSSGVASIGVYVDNHLSYVVNGNSLNTTLPLGPGNHNTVVEEWDYCGGATFTSQAITVSSQSISPTPAAVTNQGTGNVLSNLQGSGGWKSWGELAPAYNICSGCSGVTWSMSQAIKSPSLSGNATQFNIGGTTPYSDVLWSNPVIGQNTTQNIPDTNHSLLPNLHSFTYDTDFYVTNAAITQVLEFDINMYMNGVGMTWGSQCNYLGGNDWNIFDNVNVKWVPTGIACNLKDNAWNHVTIQVQREPDNTLLYQSVTLNGVTANINMTFPPFSVPVSWWGVTVNYQMDGNYKQAANTTYLDNFSLTYW